MKHLILILCLFWATTSLRAERPTLANNEQNFVRWVKSEVRDTAAPLIQELFWAKGKFSLYFSSMTLAKVCGKRKEASLLMRDIYQFKMSWLIQMSMKISDKGIQFSKEEREIIKEHSIEAFHHSMIGNLMGNFQSAQMITELDDISKDKICAHFPEVYGKYTKINEGLRKLREKQKK